MQEKRLFVLCVLSVVLLCTSICPLFAKAPTTPKILFTSARDDNYEVYIMNPDGSEQMNLTQHPANDVGAVWSPTGEQILFVSDRDGVRDLHLMDADGSNVRRVFKKEANRHYPSWSPDNKQIAYTHMRWDKNRFPIYIATLAEQEEEELGVDGIFPVWSPDGTEIACTIRGLITLINVRKGNQKQPIRRKAMYWQLEPDWSTAGDKFVLSGNKNLLPADRKPRDPFPPGWIDKQTIYIVNRDGTDLRQLVGEAGPKAQYPALSPNGDTVLYTQEINGEFQILKLDINSDVQTQLTHIDWNFGGDWFDPAYALPVSPQPQLLTTIWGELKRE